MLPSVPPLAGDAARRWVAAGVPRWVPRVFLTTTWFGAFLAAVAGDMRECTAADPAVCGPDLGFALWVVVCLATPVLLLWLPLAGCLAGVAFAVADVVWDDTRVAPLVFGVHGILCAVVAVRLVRAARAQQQVVREVTGGATASAPPGLVPDRPDVNLGSRAAAALLVAAAAGMLAWYAAGVRREDDHLGRAVRAGARVVAVDHEDGTITLEAGARRHVVEVLDSAQYDVGERTVVLLDPADGDWARLAGEPRDTTYWITGATGALLLAGLLLARERAGRTARSRLRAGVHPAVRIRVRSDGSGDALLLPADGDADGGRDVVLGRFRVWDAPDEEDLEAGDESWDVEQQAAFERAWRGEAGAGLEPPAAAKPAVLLGSLRDRGWALLLTEERAYHPDAPLRVARPRPPGADLDAKLLGWLPFGPWRARRDAPPADEALDELALPGRPVTSAALRAEPELPLRVRGPRGRRLRARLVAAGIPVAAPVVVTTAPDMFDRIWLAALGLAFLLASAATAREGMRLTRERLEVLSGMTRMRVPWDRLVGVRRDGEKLLVLWQSDEVVEVGPFDAVGEARGREESAEQVGALMDLLRQRALAAGAPGREVRRRFAPPWALVAAYLLVTGGALVLSTR